MVRKFDPIDAIENGFALLKKKPIIFFIALIISFSVFLFDYSFFGRFPYTFYGRGNRFAELMIETSLLNEFLFVFILFLLQIFVSSLLIKIAYEKRVDISKAIKFVFGKYLILLVSTILFGLIVGAGLLLLIIPGIFLLIKLLFYQYAIIIENKGIITSLERSWEITNGNWLRIFALFIFLFIISLSLGFVCVLLYLIFNWLGILSFIILQAFISSLNIVAFLEAFKKLSGK
ncbi:MAG: hypothetical protein KQA36_03475 [Candidatus Aenigmarchaeota archaeon]|nr:hypothetical protein [Candidatus Aenigmarchaeota archaeon]